jgi:hypothetical protein
MFKTARFYKTFKYTEFRGEILESPAHQTIDT